MILTVWEIDFSIKCALIECLKLKKKRCLQEVSVTVAWQGQDAVVQVTIVQVTIVQDALVQDTIVQVTIVQDALVQDTVVQDAIVQVTVVDYSPRLRSLHWKCRWQQRGCVNQYLVLFPFLIV